MHGGYFNIYLILLKFLDSKIIWEEMEYFPHHMNKEMSTGQ